MNACFILATRYLLSSLPSRKRLRHDDFHLVCHSVDERLTITNRPIFDENDQVFSKAASRASVRSGRRHPALDRTYTAGDFP